MTLLEKLSQNDFTLSMSSGFFGFFAHCGFAKAVFSEGLNPKLITGSSAGAIVAACIASGMTPSEIEKEFLGLTKKNYWDPAFGAGFLKGHAFENTLSQFVIPEIKDAKWPLHLATFDVAKRRTKIFMDGPLPKIVRASCAVPLFFHPVKIDGRFYLDGGIQDKMGWSALTDSKDLIFGHSLSSGWFESKPPAKTRTRFILNVNGLPPTGPNQFHNAPEAITITYEATKAMLNSIYPTA